METAIVVVTRDLRPTGGPVTLAPVTGVPAA
jgi:hypothetical protein